MKNKKPNMTGLESGEILHEVKKTRTILYPLRLDRAGNPISTIHRNLAFELVKHTPYSILSFTATKASANTLLEKLTLAKQSRLKLLTSSENKYFDAVKITFESLSAFNKWDAIHLVPNPALLPLTLIAKMFGKKVINTIHEAPRRTDETRNAITSSILRYFAKTANSCTSVSNFVASQAVTDWQVSSQVIPNGIDASFFSPKYADKAAVEKLYGVDTKHKKLVLYVGALIEGKGSEIVAETCTHRSDISCLIVGNGPLKNKITEVCLQNPHIKQIDYLSAEELRVLYASADVFFFPSSIDSFGLVYLESLASGTPVLSVNEAAAPEIIIKQSQGILVRTRAAFSVSLAILLKSKPKRSELADYVKHTFAWDAISLKYKRVYDNLFN